MVKRKNKNKKVSQYLIIGSFFLVVGMSVIVLKLCSNYFINEKENNSLEEFFEIKQEEQADVVIEKVEEQKQEVKQVATYNYIAVLEIPRINLKRGLVAINDKNNNVNKNIEILKDADMPDVQNGNFILAGHSGNSRISYFRNLNKMELNDFIYVYYKGKRYNYQIKKVYDVEKTGQVSISKTNNTTTLTLVTCRHNTSKQIVIIAELISKEEY